MEGSREHDEADERAAAADNEGGSHSHRSGRSSSAHSARNDNDDDDDAEAEADAEADAPKPPSYRSFSRSGINTANPFHSNRGSILGVHPPAGSAAAAAGRPQRADRFAEREAARRREREDELYFNAKYSAPARRRSGGGSQPTASASASGEGDDPDSSRRSDADYAFLRRGRSELPLRDLNPAQKATARELADDEQYAARQGRSKERSVYEDGLPQRRSQSEVRASDAQLLETIDYLESFLQRSKRDLALKRAHGGADWQRELEAMGGPERAGRRSAGIEVRDLWGGPEEKEQPRPRSARYAAPTVSSSPFTKRTSPFATPSSADRSRSAAAARAPAGYQRPEEELALARLESEVAMLRRKAAGVDMTTERPRPASDEAGLMQQALSNLRAKGELERSIAYLEEYTEGRRPVETEDETWGADQMMGTPSSSVRRRSKSPGASLGRSASASRLYSPSSSGVPSSRVPSSHPHATGKNHVPANCIYCAREMDWRSYENGVVKLMQQAFPERAEALAGKPRESGVQSRLRPLARKMMMDTARARTVVDEDTGEELPISRDVDSHFLAQLSAAERRRQANRLDSLWYLVGNSERDRQAQLVRISREIEAESTKRAAHMKWVEEQAIERALSRTMLDRAQEREIQKLLQDQQARVTKLLDLKRQSLANYTRDQIDLVKERRRVEAETAKLRAQNDKHSLREMARQEREQNEARKQRKLDQIRHAEDKYAFKMSELKRPDFAERGVDDLAHWRVGRALNASI